MKDFFYSLKASYYFFFALAVIFGVGSQLSKVEQYDYVFREMTSTDIWSCIHLLFAEPLLVLWLAALALIGLGLFINTCCCTTTQLKKFLKMRSVRVAQSTRLRGMAYIHIVALVVIAWHAADIILVERHHPVKAYIGETVMLGDSEITVDSISFVSTRTVITEDERGRKMPSFRIPTEDFALKENFALLSITRDGKQPETHEIRMLDPVRIGGSFFFLDGFFIENGTTEIGIELHYSYNPLALPFFLVYTILFSLLVFHLYVNRWQGTSVVKSNE